MALAEVSFFSEFLRQQYYMNVILPEQINGYSALPPKKYEPPYPVLYLLHGTSQNHTDWTRFCALERYAQRTGLVIVMPATQRAWYTNQKIGYPFYDFFTKELPLTVKRFFNISDKREDTFVAGVSMGGYGAIKFAANFPERFAAAASLSGSVDMIYVIENSKVQTDKAKMHRNLTFGTLEEMRGSEMDTVYMLEKRLREGTPLPKFYVCCGEQDYLLPVNRHFRDIFEGRLDMIYVEGEGAHKWEYWDEHIQKILKWLPIQR